MVRQLYCFLGVSFLAVGLITAAGGDWLLDSSRSAPTTTFLTTDRSELDFGNACQHSSVDLAFRMTNNGTVPIVVLTPVASCGCTIVNIQTGILAPQEVRDVAVRINTGSTVGSFRKAIEIPYHPAVEVSEIYAVKVPIVGTVKDPVTLEPEVVRFKKEAGRVHTSAVVVRPQNPGRIRSADSLHDCISTAFEKSDASLIGGVRLLVTFDMVRCPDLLNQSSIAVIVVDDAGRRHIRYIKVEIED